MVVAAVITSSMRDRTLPGRRRSDIGVRLLKVNLRLIRALRYAAPARIEVGWVYPPNLLGTTYREMEYFSLEKTGNPLSMRVVSLRHRVVCERGLRRMAGDEIDHSLD